MNLLAIKWLAVGSLFLAVFFGGWRTGAQVEESKWLKKELQAKEAQTAQQLANYGKDFAYELRIKDLEADVRSKPARVVRLCKQDPVYVPGDAGQPDGAGADGSAGVAGPDIGSGLREFALAYRKCAERLNELQGRVNSVASSEG